MREVALSVVAAWVAAFVPGVGQVVAGGGVASRASSGGGTRLSLPRRMPFSGVVASAAAAPQTIGTGRASGSYLLLARRTYEACAASRLASPWTAASGAQKALAVQCLSVLGEARFGADVQFSVDE